jgi:hypothetical protein
LERQIKHQTKIKLHKSSLKLSKLEKKHKVQLPRETKLSFQKETKLPNQTYHHLHQPPHHPANPKETFSKVQLNYVHQVFQKKQSPKAEALSTVFHRIYGEFFRSNTEPKAIRLTRIAFGELLH